VTTAVPELRIVDDELWNQVKVQQQEMRRIASNGDPKRFNQARRPKYFFSGLTKRAECGGGYVMYWRDRLACFGARSRGTCTNRLTISRQEVEERLLVALGGEESRTGAVDAIRALVETIVLERDGERLKITLKGDLAGMLSAARPPSHASSSGARASASFAEPLAEAKTARGRQIPATSWSK
jgi:hypothetical protein